jgi:hypothetical protein
MAWYNEDNPETLNFMVAGNRKCGHSLLQSSLSAHPEMICHGDVLHDKEDVRKREHEEYFGDSGRVPDWYLPGYLSMEQYLNNKIFDNTLFEEKAVGVKVGYQQFVEQDLWDYTIGKCRQGDFCLVHVQRNPVACFVELLRSGEGPVESNFLRATQHSVTVDLPLLTEFVRNHMATAMKIDRLCDDRAVISYHELLLDFRGTVERLFEYLGIRYSSACIPNLRQVRQVRQRGIRETVSNWLQLLREAPSDVREQLEDPTLL